MSEEKKGFNIPWSAAQIFGEQHGCDQIIVHGYKRGEGQSVATWGKTVQDSDQAAVGGNHIKTALLSWPEHLSNAVPDRVRRLQAVTKELIEKAELAVRNCECPSAMRHSGHRTDCFAPELLVAIERAQNYLRELFPENEVRS